MKVRKNIEVIVEHDLHLKSNEPNQIYGLTLNLDLDDSLKGEDRKKFIMKYWDQMENHIKWSLVEHELPKEGELRILALKSIT